MVYLGEARLEGDPVIKTDTKKQFGSHIGSYYYFSLLLANFDPVRAMVIHDNPAHDIAEAYVSMLATQHSE